MIPNTIVGAGSEDSHSPVSSPKASPLHLPSKNKFNLFRRKEKARSQSVRTSDFNLENVKKSRKNKAVISFPGKLDGSSLVS